MPKPKIDKVKLNQLLRSGKSQREIAQVFGVTESAISKAKKELNISVIKNVALENAHRVVDKSLNSVDQLQKINGHANELLDLCMKCINGDEEAIQVLENKDKAPVSEYKFKDPREIALKAMAEIRGQLKIQLDIFQTLYDMRTVQEFQQEVLETISSVSKEAKDEIIKNLREKRALRSAVRFD